MMIHRHESSGLRQGSQRAAQSAGFTLVEVLIATFILALGVLGLAALFAGGVRQQQLASEATRATSFTEAALALEANFGVMSSLDEDGDGRSDFEQVIDIGRWYALATQVDEDDALNFQRVSLVTTLGNGNVVRYDPNGTGPAITRFQPFFRRVNNTPIVLYQRPKFWAPRLNYGNAPWVPMSEASPSLDSSGFNYDPQQPGSPFVVPPYRLYDASPTTPEGEKVRGPAFLPDRAILPDSVELTVTYFDYADRFVEGVAEVVEGFDRFTNPDGTGQTLPAANQAANVLGRAYTDPRTSSFRWVNPRSSLLGGTSPIIPLNDRLPRNTLPGQVLSPPGTNGMNFPSRNVWNPNDQRELYYYGVYTPNGAYPEVDTANYPELIDIAERPAYLVLYLSPDFVANDLDTPNPTLVAFELGGVLTDRLRAPDPNDPLNTNGLPAGPLRSIDQIRVDRYVSRQELMPSPRERVVTVPDATRSDGRRPVIGYSSLYRRTPDGKGELAIFGYRINPMGARGTFVPREDPDEFNADRYSPIVSSRFDVAWDDARQQFYVVYQGSQHVDGVIRVGTQILFAGPEGSAGSVTESVEAFGADAAVRIVARVRVGNQLRGYLDAPPLYRGRPLGNLGNATPGQQSLMGWHVRDRVLSDEPVRGETGNILPANSQPLYKLESLDVRIVPMQER